VKAQVMRTDAPYSVFTHEHRRVHIVQNVSLQMRNLGDDFGKNFPVSDC